MNKLSKRAISIIVIATFLISMIPIMPVMAATPEVEVSSWPIDYYSWTTEKAKRDFYSLHVTLPITGDVDAQGIDVIAPLTSSITLAELTELTFWEYVVVPGGEAGYTGPGPAGDVDVATGITLYMDMNADGEFVWADDVQFIFESPYNSLTVTDNLDEWVLRDLTDESHGFHGWAKGTTGKLDVGPEGSILTLADWKATAYSTYEVLKVGLVLGWGNYGNYDGYLDDIKVNGVTYPLTIDLPESEGFTIDYVTPGDVDYADVLTVIGSGVTAGSQIKVFWDYASGTYAHLLNTTEGNPDGSFDCEVTVPSDVVGAHYLWVTDVATGATVKSELINMIPRIKLSPSSGLVGDEITVKGYGFADESDVTVTFNTVVQTTSVETDELGYFTYKFDIPTLDYDTYPVVATDDKTNTDSANFVLGASITLTPTEGPTGTVVEVKGRGWTKTETISFTMDGKTDLVVDDDVVTVKSDGTFSAEIVIPGVDSAAEYEITAIESGNLKGPGKEDFEVDGIQKLKVDPTYGTPGATITVTGANFTQIAGTEVTVMIGAQTLVTAETESDGTFEDTFVSPAIEFTSYDVVATDEYNIVADDAFKVGLIVLIINPVSGEAGTKVSLTGIGFTPGDYNVTFASSDESYTKLYEEYGIISYAEAIADPFYIPNVEPGAYYLTVSDTDENELTVHFTVTATSKVVLDPSVAPNEYNVSIEGYNFADVKDGEVDFVIYNVTADGEVDLEEDMDVYTFRKGSKYETETDADGNFTGYWIVLNDEILSIGDYTVNVTGPKGLLVQVPFSVVVARVSVAPRKAEFDRGNRIQFDIHNDFKLRDSYIKIYDPYDTLYWKTEPFADDWWLRVEGLYTVPYYRQTAAGNEMELQGDAPMGAWLYIFYDVDDEQLMNGTFSVGPSSAAQIDALLEDVRSDLSGLSDDVSDLGGEFDALSDEIGGVASDLDNLKDDIVDDLAADIAAATDAGNAASDAVADLEGSMSDLEDSMGDIADASNSALDAAQDAADAAADAASAAEGAGDAAKGLTSLVYGAIGASLIAALAAIVSLMQISKKIAG